MKSAASLWFWRDWESDVGLKVCSLAAQGLWMRMLCIAAQHDPIGYVSINCVGLDPEGIAKIVGVGVDDVRSLIGELSQNGVFSRDRNGTIYNRRMTRDAKKSAIARKNGSMGGNPTLRNERSIGLSVIHEDNDALMGADKLKPIPIPVIKGKNIKKVRQEEFQQFWDAYGHKVDRPRAEKALAQALTKAPLAQIIEGVRQYRARLTDIKFIKDPAAWLNGERWADTPAANGAGKLNGGNVPPGVYVRSDTPQGDAWETHSRQASGKSQVWDRKGGWYFPTEWPPGMDGKNGLAHT